MVAQFITILKDREIQPLSSGDSIEINFYALSIVLEKSH